MKLKSILVIFGVVLLIFFLFRACTSYLKNKIDDPVKGLTKAPQTEFLEDVDFTEGNYALVLDDEKLYLLIDDAAILAANQN